jgi:exodeoxyribonuclease-1
MATSSYLFYDLETTGLNKAFDQVLQFAAIRTNQQLEPLNRYEIEIRLRPDVLYSPEAMLTTGISVSDALAFSTSEYEAAQRIHVLMNQPGTTSIGYNSLGFDDEFLRFMFYRNLLPPYDHQWKNECSRMDILPLAALYYLYQPDIIEEWPVIDGKPSLKLEHLNAANQWVEGSAHDAMVDVEVTLALAQQMIKAEELWTFAQTFFDKPKDQQRINKLESTAQLGNHSYQSALLVSVQAGSAQRYQMPVLHLGQSKTYTNQSLWLRLDQEPETFQELAELSTPEAEDLTEATWVVRKKYGEPPLVLPPHDRYWEHLPEEIQERAKDNLQWLIDHPKLLQQITNYYRNFTWPEIPDIDPYAALYQGFISNGDAQLATQFHLADLDEKKQLLNQFSDQRFTQLAERIINIQDPNRSANQQFGVDAIGQPRTTREQMMERIAQLLDEVSNEQSKELLYELKNHLLSE